MGLFKDETTNRGILQQWERVAIEEFQAKMMDRSRPFPCIPATQGHSLDQFRYGFVGDPRDSSSANELASLLSDYTVCSRKLGTYTSLIIFFETPHEIKSTYTVDQFEQLFWDQLARLRGMDELEWPSKIPIDPHDPIWEFCYNNEQYFMYCATPAHENRRSRHFSTFMLAITPRWVLDQFNASPSFAKKVKSNIRHRLESYDSIPVHPDLNSYGLKDNFEWKQYFLHDDATSLSRCPFHKILIKEEERK
ncbi:YqcI/YcgG family protein [Bacillus sp. DJP31]|uniref:YqcI/YcgG family protein n=1 Tax=Bacillus sp. DJP31 TaxID=3409789 RepID=UPI003BB74E2A